MSHFSFFLILFDRLSLIRSNMSQKNKRTDVGRIVVWIVCLILYTGGYSFYRKTLVAWWIPVSAAAATVLLTAPMLLCRWKALTASENKALLWICHAYVVGSVLYFSLTGGNFLLAAPVSSYEESVLVEKRIERTRKKYRRLTHRRMVPDGVTTTYALQVLFDDSTRKEIPVSRSEYRASRPNDRKTLTLRKGFFGFPVITKVSGSQTVPVPTGKPEPHSEYERRHS